MDRADEVEGTPRWGETLAVVSGLATIGMVVGGLVAGTSWGGVDALRLVAVVGGAGAGGVFAVARVRERLTAGGKWI